MYFRLEYIHHLRSEEEHTAAIAKLAVANALVFSNFSARLADGGSQILVKTTGFPGMCKERSFVARACEVTGLKLVILFKFLLEL